MMKLAFRCLNTFQTDLTPDQFSYHNYQHLLAQMNIDFGFSILRFIFNLFIELHSSAIFLIFVFVY